ncbi:MAG: retention module-containing protein, partial [Rhodoferax sp.]|nr:retention module-containing protein [Rhodoferax sp.]
MATTIAAINGSGQAFAVNTQGVPRPVKAGDILQKGEIIRTVGDVQVELLMDDGRMLAVAPNQELRLDDNVTESAQRPTAQDSAVVAPAATADTILQALERGTDLSTQLEATAAGLGGGGGADGGSSFVQLLRVTEGVDPLAYDYSYQVPAPLQGLNGVLEVPLVTDVNEPPVFVDPANPTSTVASYSFSYAENSTTADVLGSVKATDVDAGANITYSITAGDPNGYYAVDANGQITLSAAGVAALTNDYETLLNTRDITVTANDSQGATTDITVTLTETNVNEPLTFTNPNVEANGETPASYSFSYAENNTDDNVIG